jgi:hypothetical protein
MARLHDLGERYCMICRWCPAASGTLPADELGSLSGGVGVGSDPGGSSSGGTVFGVRRCSGPSQHAAGSGFDLKVVAKDPVDVTTGDVLDFITVQRGNRRVVRISDGESDGLSARTIQRRLSMVVGPVFVLVVRADLSVSAKMRSAAVSIVIDSR